MAVIVQVPDDTTSRLARRLIGRRSGVRVVVSDTPSQPTAISSPVAGSDRVIVVGVPANGDRKISLLRQGVWAVIPASVDSINRSLSGYVDDVRAGLCPLLSEITQDRGETEELVEAIRRRPNRPSKGNAANPLSERETEILQRISRGVTSREIAQEMGFQVQTVKNQVTVILTKTRARSRTHAVSIALSRGWISAP